MTMIGDLRRHRGDALRSPVAHGRLVETLRVEAVDRPPLAIAPDPPIEPMPPAPPPPAPAPPPPPTTAEAHAASVREAALARHRKGGGKPRVAGPRRPPAPVPPPVAPSAPRHPSLRSGGLKGPPQKAFEGLHQLMQEQGVEPIIERPN